MSRSRRLFRWLAAQSFTSPPRRLTLLRRTGLTIDASHVGEGCVFLGDNVTIGASCWITGGTWFDDSSTITIGDRVAIGPRCLLLTSTHDPVDPGNRSLVVQRAPIVIEDGAWLGAGVIVCPGVTIGHGSVVGAGAVVLADCEPDAVYVGVPARKVRTLLRETS